MSFCFRPNLHGSRFHCQCSNSEADKRQNCSVVCSISESTPTPQRCVSSLAVYPWAWESFPFKSVPPSLLKCRLLYLVDTCTRMWKVWMPVASAFKSWFEHSDLANFDCVKIATVAEWDAIKLLQCESLITRATSSNLRRSLRCPRSRPYVRTLLKAKSSAALYILHTK